MELRDRLKILFVINPFSGNTSFNWSERIASYYKNLNHSIEIYLLDENFKPEDIIEKITIVQPDLVVAVGGDGTINAVADCLLEKNIPLGILPAGSANALAKELGISNVPLVALQTLHEGSLKKIHLIKINDQLCIHLSDIGFNAWMIKKFQAENIRGFWGYFKANITLAWKTLFLDPKFKVSMTVDQEKIETKAVMIVIANATTYGTGAVINPTGNMEDDFFEVIVIKKISIVEVFKMLISHASFNPHKTAVFKTKNLNLKLEKKMHFQIDGEYFGKKDEIEAAIIPSVIEIMVPRR